jgi:hypothetical protein
MSKHPLCSPSHAPPASHTRCPRLALDHPYSPREPQARSVWSELKRIPDANGNAQGVTLGSLEPRAEMRREEMKPTAASLQNVYS